MHKIEGWSKVRGGGPKWRIQGLWVILSRSDYKLEPAESWGRLSLNDWSPQSLPPQKNLTLFVPLHLHPKPPKKSVSGKKTQWVFASPVWQQVIMCCSCVTTWSLLRPASSIIRPLYEWSLSAAFENDHYDFCWLNLSLVSPGIFVNSQNIVFVSMFGQLCRAVVGYKCQSGLCVCYHIPSWWAVINSIINRYCLAPTSSFLGNASGTVHTYLGVLGKIQNTMDF